MISSKKTLLPIIVVLLSALVVVSVAHLVVWNKHFSGDIVDARKEIHSFAATLLNENILDNKQVLAYLASTAAVKGSDPAACNSAVGKLLSQNAYRFVNIGVLDTRGFIWCSGIKITKPVNAADRAYFRRAMASGDFAVGDYEIGRITGINSINFSYPVKDDAGKITGVVYLAMPVAHLADELNSYPLDEGSTFSLIDGASTVIVNEPGNKYSGSSVYATDLGKIILSGDLPQDVRTADVDGVVRDLNVSALPGSIYLVVSNPLSPYGVLEGHVLILTLAVLSLICVVYMYFLYKKGLY